MANEVELDIEATLEALGLSQNGMVTFECSTCKDARTRAYGPHYEPYVTALNMLKIITILEEGWVDGVCPSCQEGNND